MKQKLTPEQQEWKKLLDKSKDEEFIIRSLAFTTNKMLEQQEAELGKNKNRESESNDSGRGLRKLRD